jgi:hypothetical protein
MCWASGIFLALLRQAVAQGRPQAKRVKGSLDRHFFDYTPAEIGFIRAKIDNHHDSLSFEHFFRYVRAFFDKWLQYRDCRYVVTIPYDSFRTSAEQIFFDVSKLVAPHADMVQLRSKVKQVVTNEPFKPHNTVNEILRLNIVSRGRLIRAERSIADLFSVVPGIRPIFI